MNANLSAEEFLSNYNLTLNPFNKKISHFEFWRLKLLLERKLKESKTTESDYLLNIYLDIIAKKKFLNSFDIRLLQKLDLENNNFASFLIYYCYKNNITPFTNIEEGISYLLKAYKNNYSFAFEEIIELKYTTSLLDDINIDILKCISLIEDTDKRNLFFARYNIESSDIKTKNSALNEIINLYNQGVLLSPFILGDLYDKGIFIPRNISLAVFYYQKSLEHHCYIPCKRLACIFSSGENGIVDINRALRYYHFVDQYNNDNDIILDVIKLQLETKNLTNEEISSIIKLLNKINNDKSFMLLGQIYLDYSFLRKEKEGIFMLNYYANINTNLFYKLYLYFSHHHDRKEAIRYLRKGIVLKNKLCIDEARGYTKLSSLLK